MLFSAEKKQKSEILTGMNTPSCFIRRTNKFQSTKFDQLAFFSDEEIKTSKHIRKTNIKSDYEDLLSAVNHFEKPMDLELDLDEAWK